MERVLSSCVVVAFIVSDICLGYNSGSGRTEKFRNNVTIANNKTLSPQLFLDSPIKTNPQITKKSQVVISQSTIDRDAVKCLVELLPEFILPVQSTNRWIS